MKFISYILTLLLLVVNMHFTNAYTTDVYMGNKTMECGTVCCSVEDTTSDTDMEKPKCCSDAYCTSLVNAAYAINYSYSPKIPSQVNVKEFLPLVYTYTNLYSLSHIHDFWNPPKV